MAQWVTLVRVVGIQKRRQSKHPPPVSAGGRGEAAGGRRRWRPRPPCSRLPGASRSRTARRQPPPLASRQPLPSPTPHSGHTCPSPSPSPGWLRRPRPAAMSDYDPVNVEDDVEAVIIDNSEAEDGENGLSTQSCVSMEQNSEVNSSVHHVPQLTYGSEGLSVLTEQVPSQMSHSASMQRGNGHTPEKMDFVFLHNKRKRLAPTLVGQNVIRTREGEYEDSDSVIYEYEPDYECGSIVSEASYIGDQQKTLMEVLSYCQAMYDAIQKLDKKLDLLHRKVSEMQHTRVRPLLLKPVSIKEL
ncbi:sex comb on midleg-like protein 1 [Mergus octosetaceus]